MTVTTVHPDYPVYAFLVLKRRNWTKKKNLAHLMRKTLVDNGVNDENITVNVTREFPNIPSDKIAVQFKLDSNRVPRMHNF